MKPSICFVAPSAYAVLSGRSDIQHIGGAEVQQALIARGLVKRGYRVSFVTLDHGQPDAHDLDGITVYRAYRPRAGVPGLRLIHPRATLLWSAMRRADADIYYQRTSDLVTGVVAAYCRSHRRRFVFGLGSLKDCLKSLPSCRPFRERAAYLYGLRRASRVVAQTRTQQERLNVDFGVDSVIIPSCVAPPSVNEPSSPTSSARILWIGRFVWEKRFEVLLDVAEQCGEGVAFDVLGSGPNTTSVKRLLERASTLANVRMHGYVPHRDALKFYDNASALICTSVNEGFPNTFLEAWCRRVPVVTTFDPDGVVAANELGVHVSTPGELADPVRAVCFDETLRARMSQNAFEYYRKNHTVESVVTRYQELFGGLTSGAS